MRHLIGLILGLALAAAMFFAAGWGAEHVPALVGHSVGAPSRTGLIGLGVMLGTGLLLGILLGWTALLAVSSHRALAWIPLQGHAFGAGFRILLLNGTLALAGMAMIVPMFLPSRWRSRRYYDDEDSEDLDVQEVTGLLS